MSDPDKFAIPVVLKMTGNPIEIPGFVYGLRHPCLLVRLTFRDKNHSQWLRQVNEAFADAIQKISGDHEKPHFPAGDSEQSRLVYSLLFWMNKLQYVVKVPVFEPAKIIGFNSKKSLLVIAIPTLSSLHSNTKKLFFWFLNVFNGVYSGRDIDLLLKDLPLVIKELKQMVPHASNMPRFLKAAFTLGIPYSEITEQIYQFGYGSRVRLLDSSFTDQTSRIGVWLARNKIHAAAVLRIAGIPVPDHMIVSDIKGAEKAASELEFPVVVKPADLDGGVGVSAGLTTIEEVCKAFTAAQKKSNTILVEKHHYGRDYRLTVFHDELIWAIERIPGGVTGDGKSSIQLLVEQLNRDPRRGDGPHSSLKRLVIDDEAKELLLKNGISPDSIPQKGEFVCLRRTANVATGGLPVAVFEKVHPDNSLLAVRAAAALRLDLAGIDLLIPDISRSWRESGAAVCEINAQPYIGDITAADLYPQILQKMLPGRGRIPIVVIIGATPEWNEAAAIAARLNEAGFTTGKSDDEGISVGNVTIAGNKANPYTAGRILAGEKGVTAIVLGVNDMSVMHTGLPFDRFDLLVFAGSYLRTQQSTQNQPESVHFRALYNLCSPGCDGNVIVAGAPEKVIPQAFELLPQELLKNQVTQHQIVVTIIEVMIDAEKKLRSR